VAKIPMMAITTSNSIKVKPFCLFNLLTPFLLNIMMIEMASCDSEDF